MSRATLVEISPFPATPGRFGWRNELLVAYLLPFPPLTKQSKLFFQGQLIPGFPGDDPDTVDCRLKLNFGTWSNIVRIGDRFGQGHLEFTGYSAHVPYSSKDTFLVKAGVCSRKEGQVRICAKESEDRMSVAGANLRIPRQAKVSGRIRESSNI